MPASDGGVDPGQAVTLALRPIRAVPGRWRWANVGVFACSVVIRAGPGTLRARFGNASRGCWGRWTAQMRVGHVRDKPRRRGVSCSVFRLEGCECAMAWLGRSVSGRSSLAARWRPTVRQGARRVPQRCHRAEKGAEFRGPPVEHRGVVRTSDWQTRGLAFGTLVERFGAPPLLIDLVVYLYVDVLYGYCCYCRTAALLD